MTTFDPSSQLMAWLSVADVGWYSRAKSVATDFARGEVMKTVKIVVWQDGDAWLGYLQEYPDYWTQGESLDDVKEHLNDLYVDLSGGAIAGARRVEDMIVS